MSILIRIALVAAAIASVIGAYTWWRHGVLDEGVQKERAVWVAKEKRDDELRASDARQQRQFNDIAATKHLATVDRITNQLGAAREKIATLSGHQCLDFDTVRVLNAISAPASDQRSGAATGQPTGAPQAAASDRDVGEAIATCRAWYGQVADQLNQILDIEDSRHPPAPGR